ncbi:hypothetical protein HMPREF0995_02559 [Lachnospiraceae bacterium 7_1_58FAA]|nr:hypothetical protein HMPREF0995_02559 [Lachnospiraceae bacterium 7_1_58FAA]
MFLKYFKKRIFVAIKQRFTLTICDIKNDIKTHLYPPPLESASVCTAQKAH